MNLKELSVEYRASALACRRRADELRPELRAAGQDFQAGCALRLRIAHLEDMAAGAESIARFLAHYYGR